MARASGHAEGAVDGKYVDEPARGGERYSEANGSKEIKEHSLHEKLPQRNIVLADCERECRVERGTK